MALTELNEDTLDIIFHLLENLQYIEKLKNLHFMDVNKKTTIIFFFN